MKKSKQGRKWKERENETNNREMVSRKKLVFSFMIQLDLHNVCTIFQNYLQWFLRNLKHEFNWRVKKIDKQKEQ